MLEESIHVRRTYSKLPGYYMEMICQVCGRIYPASNTGVACKYCRSTQVIPGDNWLPLRSRGKRRV